MSDRDWILNQVKTALAPLPKRTDYPDWPDSMAVTTNDPSHTDKLDLFQKKIEMAHAKVVEGFAAVKDFLKAKGLTRGYVDPVILSSTNLEWDGLELETIFDRNRVDDYQFGITRATAGIAETGSIVLNDRDTSSRLGALAPWLHVAVLSKKDIFADVPSALAALDYDPSIILVTGPSKTADIEGILIEGVHGPGVQICCLVE